MAAMPRACAPAAAVCVLGCILCGVNAASHVKEGSTTDAMPLPLLKKVPSQTHNEVPPDTQASTGAEAGLASDGGRPRTTQPTDSFGREFTFVVPGAFDEPLDLIPDGQHGRALSECVSAASRTLRLPLQGPHEVTNVLDSRCLGACHRFRCQCVRV